MIWKNLMPMLNLTSKMIMTLLVEGFNLREDHTMMEEFSNVDLPHKFLEQLKEGNTNTDDKMLRGHHKEDILQEDDVVDVTRRSNERDPTDAELAVKLRDNLMLDIMQENSEI